MKYFLFIVLAIITLAGCKKEEVVGPQGPQGNANVESIEFTYSFSLSPENPSVGAVQNWEVLTEEMVNEGGVFVYLRSIAPPPFGQDTSYTMLPTSNLFWVISSQFRIGEIEVYQSLTSPSSGFTASGTMSCRAIAIAPRSMALGEEHVQQLIAAELAK